MIAEDCIGKKFRVVKKHGQLWVRQMDDMIGKVYECSQAEEFEEGMSLYLNGETFNTRWWFLPQSLELVEDKPDYSMGVV